MILADETTQHLGHLRDSSEISDDTIRLACGIALRDGGEKWQAFLELWRLEEFPGAPRPDGSDKRTMRVRRRRV